MFVVGSSSRSPLTFLHAKDAHLKSSNMVLYLKGN